MTKVETASLELRVTICSYDEDGLTDHCTAGILPDHAERLREYVAKAHRPDVEVLHGDDVDGDEWAFEVTEDEFENLIKLSKTDVDAAIQHQLTQNQQVGSCEILELRDVEEYLGQLSVGELVNLSPDNEYRPGVHKWMSYQTDSGWTFLTDDDYHDVRCQIIAQFAREGIDAL